MLADSHDGAILFSLHDTLNGTHALPQLDDFALNKDLAAGGHGSQISDVEGATDTEVLPEAGLVY